MIMEGGKSRICRVVQYAGDSGEPMFQFQSESRLLENQKELVLQMRSKGSLPENSLLLGGRWSSCSSQAFN